MKTIEEVRKDYPYATVMTIEDYLNSVQRGSITAYDGVGFLHNGDTETAISAMSMAYTVHTKQYPYVCFYGK